MYAIRSYYVTLWLTNIFHKNNYELSPSLEQAKNEWQKFIQQDFTLIVVSNELGMGLHADSEAGRRFTDLQGWMNHRITSYNVCYTKLLR